MTNCNAKQASCIIIVGVTVLLLGDLKFRSLRFHYNLKDNHRTDFSIDKYSWKDKVNILANNGKIRGYVLGWDFDEGQTCASRNLLSLVHWASDIDLTVVEPCVHNSFFNLASCILSSSAVKVNGSSAKRRPPLSFRDYFDVDHWNHQILSDSIGKPLTPWEKFIKNKPDKAIIVYTWAVQGKTSAVYIDNEIERDAIQCHQRDIKDRPQFSKAMFSKLGINISREVCFRHDNFVPMDLEWFNQQIFGDHDTASRVLILFTHWTGTFKAGIYLNKPEYIHMKVNDYLKPSPHVIKQSKKYIERFLRGGSYLAVQLRTAKIARLLKDDQGKSQEDILHYLSETCSHEVSTALKNENSKRMLALDLGRFGDGESSLYLTTATVQKTIPPLVASVYGGTWNWTQWEDSFAEVAGTTDNGYIAMMQKVLVSNAACIIIGGKGEFHNTLMNDYKAKGKRYCVHEVCKPPYSIWQFFKWFL